MFNLSHDLFEISWWPILQPAHRGWLRYFGLDLFISVNVKDKFTWETRNWTQRGGHLQGHRQKVHLQEEVTGPAFLSGSGTEPGWNPALCWALLKKTAAAASCQKVTFLLHPLWRSQTVSNLSAEAQKGVEKHPDQLSLSSPWRRTKDIQIVCWWQ